MIELVAHDSLVIVLGLVVVGVAASHLLFRRHPLGRAIVRVVFLIFLTIALLHADIVPYQPLQPTGTPLRDAVHAALQIAWWLWTAWFLAGVLRTFVVVEHRPREGKLLQDLLAGLVYLAALFAIVAYVFNQPIQGLLATSGVIAIILGLALQSTLGDVFSGIVLSFSRPYRPGDWISVERGTDGRVIEMNWRATHVLTARRDLAIVPNSTIAKSRIVNVSSPSGIHGITVTVQIDGRTPPSAATAILEHAILNCRLIVTAPSPSIVIKSVTGAYSEFEITFFVETLASASQAQNELLDLVYRHLAASGIGLATLQNIPWRAADEQDSEQQPRTQLETVLGWVEIFTALTVAERAAIAAKLLRHSHDRGETLLEPGTVSQSLFIVASGVLSLTRHDGAAEVEILRLGPGDHYGEIGLLTGNPSIATITALTPVTMYELTKEELTAILEARPEVAHELCRVLALRQAAGRSATAVELDRGMPAHSLTGWFALRIQRLFDAANAHE